nr:immunoglobulin heavy chain junction region [Mus musculus]
CATWDGFGYW